MTATTAPLHIYFVLDRSGSMQSIAADVIGGFNSFLAAQQADGADAIMTLIQFDSQDSHDVLTRAAAIGQVSPLTDRTFVPRGGTPLYDAMGHAIADATIRAEQFWASDQAREEVLFVTFTDGQENQSVEYTREKLFELIKRREDDGWTFAYLGANQDAYAEGSKIGYAPGSTQNFAADASGSAAVFASLSHAVTNRRQKLRNGERYDNRDLFEGDKSAEDDLQRRNQRP